MTLEKWGHYLNVGVIDPIFKGHGRLQFFFCLGKPNGKPTPFCWSNFKQDTPIYGGYAFKSWNQRKSGWWRRHSSTPK